MTPTDRAPDEREATTRENETARRCANCGYTHRVAQNTVLSSLGPVRCSRYKPLVEVEE